MNASRRGFVGMFAAAVLGALAFGVVRAADKPYMYRLESLTTTATGLYFDTGYVNSADYDWEYILDAQLYGGYGGVNGRMQFQASWGSGGQHTWYVLCSKDGNETVYLDSKASTPVYTKSWGGQFANQNIQILALGGHNDRQYGTVYSFQLLRDGELVRDMYPVQIDDTHYGLYDRISKTVISASGSGTFTPGPIVADEDEPGEQDDTDVPALGTIYEPVANPDTTVTFRWRLAGAGIGCDSADVFVAWGATPDALTHTNLLVASCVPSVVTNAVLTGLPPESALYALLFARNASGVSEPSKTMTVTTAAMPPDETFDFGSRSIAVAESGVTSVTLRFSPGEAGVSHRLFALYGASVGGTVRGAWEHVVDLGEIASETETFVYAYPAGWGESVLALRFAFDLADEADLPYADVLEYVASNGNGQYIDTGFVGRCGETGGIEAVVDMLWNVVPQDGCFLGANNNNVRCYLVYSYPGKWNLGFGPNNDNDGIAVTAGIRYKVEAIFHGGEQKIVVNGTPVVTRSYAGPLVSGSLYLFQGNFGGNAQYGSSARLYSLSLSENGVLGRRFVPCMADGEAALFECVERKVYKNQKAGTSFVAGESVGLKQFVPFSPTVTYREDTTPLFDHVERTADEGTWATIGGALAAFGGDRAGCRVRLYLAEGLLTDGLAQVGEDVTPAGDGAFEFRVESLKGGTTYTWLVEAEGTTGEKVRSAPKTFTTRSSSQLGELSVGVVRSTVTVNGMMTQRGVGPTAVILRMGTGAGNAAEKDRVVFTDDTGAFTLVWRGYLDGCDWDAPQYWEVLAVNSDGTKAWTNVYGKATVELEDDTTYTWTGAGEANADGSRDWGDAANWSPSVTTEEQVGYPSTARAQAVFPADTREHIRFDAARKLGSVRLNDRVELTVTGAGNARHSVGALTVGADVQLTLNGASMYIGDKVSPGAGFEFTLEHGASLECGNIIYLTGADRKRMTLRDGSTYTSYGANNGIAMGGAGEVVVDNATLACNVYFDTNTGGGRLVLQGKSPRVAMNGDFRGWNEPAVDPGRGVIEFVIPEGGYAEAPISGSSMLAGGSDKVYAHELTFRVNPKSPGRKAAKAYDQPLVRAGTINLDRVVLDARGILGGDWRFVPEGSSTPTGIDYLVPARSGLAVIFR